MEMTEKEKFIDWLEMRVFKRYKNEEFFNAAWKEAQEKDANGASYKLAATYTFTRRSYLYRIS